MTDITFMEHALIVNIMFGIVIVLFLFFGLMFLIALKLERIADRYRLKYGFDRELETKEISNKDDIELKLNKREKSFKRRTFKD